MYSWYENNSPKGWTNGKIMVGPKIARQRDGRMERYMIGTKIARPMDGRMERYMVGTKIALQRDGRMRHV